MFNQKLKKSNHLTFDWYQYRNHGQQTLHPSFQESNEPPPCNVSAMVALLLGYNRLPLVIILWWVFHCIFDSLSVSIHLITRFRSIELPYPWPEANIADFASLPLSVLLCFNAVTFSCSTKTHVDLETPLVQEKNESLFKDSTYYRNAGFWSKLTFQWLNPLFSRGRIEKLELSHVPSDSFVKNKNETLNLPKAIAYAVWKSLTINGVFAGVNTIASYTGPLLITNFVNFLSENHDDSGYLQGLVLAFIFFFSKTVESLTQRQWYFGAQRIGIRVRAALSVLVYKKSLSVKFARSSNGKIINLINVDVERIGDFCWNIHGVWLLPFQVFLALVILYRNLGAAPSIAALSSTILVMKGSTPGSWKLKTRETEQLRDSQKHESLKTVFMGTDILKKLLQLRETERNWLRKYLYTSSAITFLFWASPTLVSVVTFGVCVLLKKPLTTGAVLSALATFRILQEPIYNLPELISMIAQTKVSIDRIQNFLREDDQKKQIPYQTSQASDIPIEMKIGEYAWETVDQNSRKPTIKITKNMKIMKGYKVAVCGSVGSGKSSLLCSILGEIPRISGAGVKVHGTKAYVPQSAWIQTGTVRDNVLFGKDMSKEMYEDVLEGCALNQDIEIWADGDLTVVGERGMNLSGGQKQRIQLARAVYSNSDVYILDDPFSAKCLMQLLSQKTVIYATHQLEFLDAADLVLVMKDGVIVQSGEYKDLIADPTDQVNPPQEEKPITSETSQLNQIEIFRKTQEEVSETGRVKWSVYSTFITSAYKGALVPIILLCQVLFQGLQMGSNYWIAWATEKSRDVSREKLIGMFVCSVLLATIAVETSQRLFFGMISSVFRATISFFDATPSSRILSRSSTDQSTVDTDIPYRLAGLAFALIQLLSIVVLMSQAYYISTARELARMVGIRKAPILHHFSESITGAATIRCFNQEERFLMRSLSTMEWLCIRINFLFNCGFFLVLIILINLPKFGRARSYLRSELNVLQAWIIWNLCNVENKMISVERILQFTNIPSEAPLVVEDCRIELTGLDVRYSPSLPMILKGITCTFPGGKKIGVVGRTGSGKSTLIQALFRVIEPSGGKILIDGLDISKIGLQDLRSRLGIIPQDPTLFQGTVRTNLDPLEKHSDEEIWEDFNIRSSLNQSAFTGSQQMPPADIVKQDKRLLHAPACLPGQGAAEEQKNFGLDEATASIDTETDNIIQGTIREETSRCTVITVAHRIPTVIDNDLILVLDDGKVVEYDSPVKLLKGSSSSFSKLVIEFLRRSIQE
ncbi:ABC transporter family member [Salix suchowensis]|nr:ABC transporter family member [Salix suchowensis]